MSEELNTAVVETSPEPQSAPANDASLSTHVDTQPSGPAFYEQVRGLGETFADVDETNYAPRLLEGYQQLHQTHQERESQWGQSVAFLEHELRQLRQSQSPPAGQPATVSPQSPAQAQAARRWNLTPPKFDMEKARYFAAGRDPNGGVQWKPGTPAEIQLGYQDYERFQDNVRQKLYADPENFFKPLIQDVFEEMHEAAYQKQFQQQQSQQYANQWINQNGWAFQPHPSGHGYLTDGMGRPVPNQHGQTQMQILQEIQQAQNNPQQLMQLASDVHAMRLMQRMQVQAQANQGQPQMQQPMPQQQAPARQRSPILDRQQAATATTNMTVNGGRTASKARLYDAFKADAAAGQHN